jgi:hypothetical protein
LENEVKDGLKKIAPDQASEIDSKFFGTFTE